MKTAKQMNDEYGKALDEAKGEEELRAVGKLLLSSLVAVKGMLEAEKSVANPWLITKDLITGGVAVGTSGGSGISQDQHNLLLAGNDEWIVHFCLLDDDGNVYYEGRMMQEDFDPLDDFGAPTAGCTEIRILNKDTREWETL